MSNQMGTQYCVLTDVSIEIPPQESEKSVKDSSDSSSDDSWAHDNDHKVTRRGDLMEKTSILLFDFEINCIPLTSSLALW